MEADEALLSSSGSFCLSISHVDGKPVGGKAPELAGKLQNAVIRETEAYAGKSGLFS
jgi:D-alanine transaminase